jgi:YrbI family 3-deoxy-D-manno-octulosonate 8-phosphate phosphatase
MSLKKVDGVIFDFDGVFTDNAVYIDQNGNETVKCSRLDGIGLAMLRQLKIPMIVISSEVNEVVLKRCEKLQIAAVNGVSDKIFEAKKWANNNNIEINNICFLGNDINDEPLLDIVGYPFIVQDAVHSIISKGYSILNASGGHGAVRELCELIKGDRINEF